MRSALAISASSLIILVALLPEGELRWWLVVVGLACIWLLRIAVEQERKAEHKIAQELGRDKIMNDLRHLHTNAEARRATQLDEREEY